MPQKKSTKSKMSPFQTPMSKDEQVTRLFTIELEESDRKKARQNSSQGPAPIKKKTGKKKTVNKKVVQKKTGKKPSSSNRGSNSKS